MHHHSPGDTQADHGLMRQYSPRQVRRRGRTAAAGQGQARIKHCQFSLVKTPVIVIPKFAEKSKPQIQSQIFFDYCLAPLPLVVAPQPAGLALSQRPLFEHVEEIPRALRQSVPPHSHTAAQSHTESLQVKTPPRTYNVTQHVEYLHIFL